MEFGGGGWVGKNFLEVDLRKQSIRVNPVFMMLKQGLSGRNLTWKEFDEEGQHRFDYKPESPWRVPTDKELESIVDRSLCNPATELPNVQSSFYWSSSTYVYFTDYAWIVNFDNGYMNGYNKTNSYYVRCVSGPIKLLQEG